MSVREMMRHSVRPVNGQRRLAHPRHAGDRHDHRQGACLPGVDQGVQLGERFPPAGEARHVQWQLSWWLGERCRGQVNDLVSRDGVAAELGTPHERSHGPLRSDLRNRDTTVFRDSADVCDQ